MKKRNVAFTISLTILLLSVPWFFTGWSQQRILGFPVWGFYSIGMTVIYSFALAFFLQYAWKSIEEE